MRTYEDSFSGQKIYPGKVRFEAPRWRATRPNSAVAMHHHGHPAAAEDTAAQLGSTCWRKPQGKLYIRGDSKIFRFQNGKTESLFLQRKNPRKISWTTLYRRMHKKGISEVSRPSAYTSEKGGREIWPRSHRNMELEMHGYQWMHADHHHPQEVAKKRTRRTVKHQRAIVGASLDVIKERRAQRPEARAAARSAAVSEGKEKKAAAESKKKAEKAKSASTAARGQAAKVSKQGAKGAAPKVQARTR
jgi:large subunit ribosomal protein L24e